MKRESPKMRTVFLVEINRTLALHVVRARVPGPLLSQHRGIGLTVLSICVVGGQTANLTPRPIGRVSRMRLGHSRLGRELERGRNIG
jgi:hypothetical protein